MIYPIDPHKKTVDNSPYWQHFSILLSRYPQHYKVRHGLFQQVSDYQAGSKEEAELTVTAFKQYEFVRFFRARTGLLPPYFALSIQQNQARLMEYIAIEDTQQQIDNEIRKLATILEIESPETECLIVPLLVTHPDKHKYEHQKGETWIFLR